MKKIPCERCGGSGSVDENIPGWDIYAEQDVEGDCPDCDGLGEVLEDEYDCTDHPDHPLYNKNEHFNDHPDNLIALDALYNKNRDH